MCKKATRPKGSNTCRFCFGTNTLARRVHNRNVWYSWCASTTFLANVNTTFLVSCGTLKVPLVLWQEYRSPKARN